MAETKMRQYGVMTGMLAVGLLLGWIVRGTADQPHYALTIANYQDWRLSCSQVARPDAVCELSQDIIDRKTRSSIVRFLLWHQKDKPMLSIVVPVNVLLPAGVGLRLDGNLSKNFAYKTCDQNGCLVSIAVDQSLYDSIVHASGIHIVLASLEGKPVDIALSSKGLREGAAALHGTEADSRSWLRRAFL